MLISRGGNIYPRHRDRSKLPKNKKRSLKNLAPDQNLEPLAQRNSVEQKAVAFSNVVK